MRNGKNGIHLLFIYTIDFMVRLQYNTQFLPQLCVVTQLTFYQEEWVTNDFMIALPIASHCNEINKITTDQLVWIFIAFWYFIYNGSVV